MNEEKPTSVDAAIAIRVAQDDAKPLTKTQKRFNKLLEKLAAQRVEIGQWREFKELYQKRLIKEYQPLAARLREKRIALLRLFDAALRDDSLSKRHTDALHRILTDMVTKLLAEAKDPELITLHDRYADHRYEEVQYEEFQYLKALAKQDYGIDVAEYDGEETPEEFADWLSDKIRQSKENVENATESAAGDEAKPTAREAAKAKLAEGGSRAVRQVFRKLVSELHPDREADPTERERKTELMQQVNQAYDADDLLALLELQFQTEQIDAQTLATFADEHLKSYIHVLETQSRELSDELDTVVAPFARVVGPAEAHQLKPAVVQRSLNADIADLQQVLRGIESELILFRDVRYLRASVASYRMTRARVDGDDDSPAPTRSKSRRRRS